MSAKLTKTIVALAIAALTGCELVAGIHDLAYSASASGPLDDGGTADGTTGQAESGGDAPAFSEASSDRSVEQADVFESGSGIDAAADVVREPPLDATSDAESEPTVVAAPEAGDGPAEMDAPLEGSADADGAVPHLVVPIPGLDGGIRAADGGLLLGELIDDLDSETNPGWILLGGGRYGTWFTFSDGASGGIAPAQNSAPSLILGTIPSFAGVASNLAAHMTGNGMATFAGMGFNLNGGTPTSYDATAYQGFAFWGRIAGDSATTALVFAVPDRNTSIAGGVCPADAGTGCGDYFSKNLVLTPTWQQFVIYYNQLGQTGFGIPKGLRGLDAAHIYSCQFQFSRPGPAFDVWIDDIYFVSK